MTSRYNWPMCPIATTAAVSWTFDDTGDAVANVFAAHKTGTITSVLVGVQSVTGTVPTFTLRAETTSLFSPTGTLVNTGASNTFAPSTSGTATVTLGTPASVTQGDVYGIVIKYSSGTIDASNKAAFYFRQTGTGINDTWSVPGVLLSTNAGANWSAQSSSVNAIVPIYSDGAAELDACLIQVTTNRTFATGSITHIGCRFIAPVTADVTGAVSSYGISSGSAPRTLKLLTTADSLLASQSQATGSRAITDRTVYRFATPYQVTAGQSYRLVWEAGSASASTTPTFQHPSSAAREAFHDDCYLTYKQSGSWTDATDYAPMLVPIFGNVSAGSGGGLITQRGGFTGGFSG